MSMFFAKNDVFIKQIIRDKDYKILKNGKVYKIFKKYGYSNKLKWNRVYEGKTSSGYLVISYKSKKIPIHRIVYAKYKTLNPYKMVNHKNFNKVDNRLVNLETISPQENSFYNYRKGKNKTSKLNEKLIKKIRKFHSKGLSKKDLSNIFKISIFTIYRILNKKTWTSNKKVFFKKERIPQGKLLELFVKDPNYDILSNGTIFSNINKRKLKLTKDKFVKISYKGKKLYVHRVVARKFLGKIPKGYVVNHIDGNQLNNNVKNLKIVSQADNMIHSSLILKKRPKKVYSIKKLSKINILKQKGLNKYEISKILKIHLRTVEFYFYYW